MLRKEIEELSNQKNALLIATMKLKESVNRKSGTDLHSPDVESLKKQIKQLQEEKADLYLENENLKQELRLIHIEQQHKKANRLTRK
jgi:hypothetical protein